MGLMVNIFGLVLAFLSIIVWGKFSRPLALARSFDLMLAPANFPLSHYNDK